MDIELRSPPGTQGTSNPVSRKALLVFMRYPEPGKVKSRLAAALGPQEAAAIYHRLLRRTLGVASDFKRSNPDCGIFLFCTPESSAGQIVAEFPGPWEVVHQEGEHLGERMKAALRYTSQLGYPHRVLIGSDVADIEPSDLLEAFQALADGYSAIGPAPDGGFYLIGLKDHCPPIFQHSEWGTADVGARTERLLQKSCIPFRRLRTRTDIDRPGDLLLLSNTRFLADRLSIIVPTLNPMSGLGSFLDRIACELWPDDEVIVVQGENGQHREQEPIGNRIRRIVAPRGRGIQLNHGADLSSGNLLLFLHDDSIPPHNFCYSVRSVLDDPSVSLGCFRLAFQPSTPTLDRIAAWANFRTRVFRLPYGDQGIFCRREIFQKAGGFKNRYLLEDVDFVRNCRPRGAVRMHPDSLLTSSRRYLTRGILRASFENHLILLLYYLGVQDSRLYSLYYRP